MILDKDPDYIKENIGLLQEMRLFSSCRFLQILTNDSSTV